MCRVFKAFYLFPGNRQNLLIILLIESQALVTRVLQNYGPLAKNHSEVIKISGSEDPGSNPDSIKSWLSFSARYSESLSPHL